MTDIKFAVKLPSAQAFKSLRDSAGWDEINLKQAEAALSASLGGICAVLAGELVGMARFIGDGELNIYVQDVIIAKPYQGKGHGKRMLGPLFQHIQTRYNPNCTVGLMAAKGQDSFYAQFGFIPRPSNVYGAGMIVPLGDIHLR